MDFHLRAPLLVRRALRLLVAAAFAAPPGMPAIEAAPGPPIEIRETWIAMPDGVRLSVDLYAAPAALDRGDRLPVLLEYLPYRKRESRARNYSLYSIFVASGYVVAAVDIRGTGNSEGRLVPHEYSEVEHRDGEVVIDWLAKQPWSNGNVGMFGISWGGFNAIQMALREPPALKAILAVDATEDLYQEDVHYIDGILHLDSWEMSQDLDNARPGAPEYRIDEAYFRDRFDTEPWLLGTKRRQRDSSYWDRAASPERIASLGVPSFHIGGWYDGYRDSIPRLLERVKAPVRAIVGPWSHSWPHEPYPKPGIEWRREAVRWFDHWLKGIDTGLLNEPRLAVYVRDWHPPGPYLEHAPGVWRWEDGWPIARATPLTLHPRSDRTLGAREGVASAHLLHNTPSAGVEAGGPVMWWGDVAHDQRPSDAFALIYEGLPLDAPLEILGLPLARLRVAADAPRANWFVRLSDVAPDGGVTQVAGAGFNGSHRRSAESPEAIVPDEWFDLDIEMHFTSWVFPKGHRIRLAVANAQWPMFWPTPHPLTSRLEIGGDRGARLVLPVIPEAPRPVPPFTGPEESPALPGHEALDAGTSSGYGEIASVERNPQTGAAAATATNSGGTRYPWGTERYVEKIRYAVTDEDPANAAMTGTHRMEVDLPERKLVWEAELSFRSDGASFHYDYVRRLFENDRLIREKRWTEAIARDFQ